MIITLSQLYYTALGANIFSSVCLILLIVQYYIYRKRFNRLENALLNLRNELRQQMPPAQATPLPPTMPVSAQQFRNWQQ